MIIINCSTGFVSGLVSNITECFLNISSLIRNDLIHHICYFFHSSALFCPLNEVKYYSELMFTFCINVLP